MQLPKRDQKQGKCLVYGNNLVSSTVPGISAPRDQQFQSLPRKAQVSISVKNKLKITLLRYFCLTERCIKPCNFHEMENNCLVARREGKCGEQIAGASGPGR